MIVVCLKLSNKSTFQDWERQTTTSIHVHCHYICHGTNTMKHPMKDCLLLCQTLIEKPDTWGWRAYSSTEMRQKIHICTTNFKGKGFPMRARIMHSDVLWGGQGPRTKWSNYPIKLWEFYLHTFNKSLSNFMVETLNMQHDNNFLCSNSIISLVSGYIVFTSV